VVPEPLANTVEIGIDCEGVASETEPPLSALLLTPSLKIGRHMVRFTPSVYSELVQF